MLPRGPLEHSLAWLQVREKHLPTPAVGWVSWTLTLRQELVYRKILKEHLWDQHLWKGRDKCRQVHSGRGRAAEGPSDSLSQAHREL